MSDQITAEQISGLTVYVAVYILLGAPEYKIQRRVPAVAPSAQEPTPAKCSSRIEFVRVQRIRYREIREFRVFRFPSLGLAAK